MPSSAPCSPAGRCFLSSDSTNARCLGLPWAPQVSACRRAISVTRRSDHSRIRRVSSSVGSVILGRRVRLGGAAFAGGAWGRSVSIGAASSTATAGAASLKRVRLELREASSWVPPWCTTAGFDDGAGAALAERLEGTAGGRSPPSGAPKVSARARSSAMSSAEAISKDLFLVEALSSKSVARVLDCEEMERRNSRRSSSLRRRPFQHSRQLSTARLEPCVSSVSTKRRLSSLRGEGSIAYGEAWGVLEFVAVLRSGAVRGIHAAFPAAGVVINVRQPSLFLPGLFHFLDAGVISS
mmetsp:Transcript_42958/g.104816  ORF Transcript_42958/g.104816 Transcript_42958/m.104816 type:complete len:296 (-) Transcript_42958:47-934(-)